MLVNHHSTLGYQVILTVFKSRKDNFEIIARYGLLVKSNGYMSACAVHWCGLRGVTVIGCLQN